MKAKITRTDGVVLDLEGTPEEIQKLVPFQQPWIVTQPPVNPLYPYPQTHQITWTTDALGKAEMAKLLLGGIVVQGSAAAELMGTAGVTGLGGSGACGN
jgi:hypothetical protein